MDAYSHAVEDANTRGAGVKQRVRDERKEGEGAFGLDARGDSGRTVRLELRKKASRSSSRPPQQRLSTASSLLADALPPPPAYEAAVASGSSPSPSVPSTPCRRSHRHRRRLSTSSSSSSLSDPTSDSDDPLNNLLRLTTGLLATSTSILASSTALQTSLSRLLNDRVEDEEEGEGVEEAEERTEDAPSAVTGGEGNAVAGLSTSTSLDSSTKTAALLTSLTRDVERFSILQRGRSPSTLLSPDSSSFSTARAEACKTLYVTAEAGQDEGWRKSPEKATRSGGMRRSPSAAADLLGKLAAGGSGDGTGDGRGKITRSSSGNWASLLSGGATPSSPTSSTANLASPTTRTTPRLARSSTTPTLSSFSSFSTPADSPLSTRPRDSPRRRTFTPALVKQDEDASEAEEPEVDASSKQAALLFSDGDVPASLPRLRPSLSRQTIATPPLSSPSLSTATGVSSLSTSITLLSTPRSNSTPTTTHPTSASPSATPSSARKPPGHRRTPNSASISVSRPQAALTTSLSFQSLEDELSREGPLTPLGGARSTTTTDGGVARDRFRALAGSAEVGGADSASGLKDTATQSSWWSWT